LTSNKDVFLGIKVQGCLSVRRQYKEGGRKQIDWIDQLDELDSLIGRAPV
jgi:hypothetical protein